jgi:glycosyltransferase involved in cell wall biosynthesis
MRILFLNRYAWPDVAATAQQLSDLAEHLVERGHEVSILCSSGRYRDEGEALTRCEEHEGVTYHRLRSFAHGGAGFLARAFDYAAFHLQARRWLRAHAHELDVVVALTDPPAIALHAAGLKGVRSVAWCMDILSDAALALGVLKAGSLPARLAAFLEGRSLRRVDRVVALGPCMAERLEAHGVAPERIGVIGVWADAEEVLPTEPGSGALRSALGLEDRFVVMYSGNAGLVHDFESTKQAMETLRGDASVAFVFAGGGRRQGELREFAESRGLDHVHFLPYFPRERLGEALGLADAHLVTLRRGLEGVVVPCKLYGALAAARPVLAIAPGDSTIAREVTRAGAGFALLPEDGDGLVDAIRRLAEEPDTAREMGSRGREFFEREHERRVCAARWELLLTELLGPRRRV